MKYLKKEDEGQLPAKKQETLAQPERYRRSERFKDRKDIPYAALSFSGKDQYEIVEV